MLAITIVLPGTVVALILIVGVLGAWALFCWKVLEPLFTKYAEPLIWRLVGGKGNPPGHNDNDSYPSK